MQPQPGRQVEEEGKSGAGTNKSFLPFPEGTLSRSWPGCLGRTGAVCCMPSLCPTTPSRTRVSPSPESYPHHNIDPCPSPEPNWGQTGTLQPDASPCPNTAVLDPGPVPPSSPHSDSAPSMPTAQPLTGPISLSTPRFPQSESTAPLLPHWPHQTVPGQDCHFPSRYLHQDP